VDLTRTAEALRRFGLGLPGAHEDFPWGELVLKAKSKVFVFLGKPGGDGLGFSVKLPRSGERLLDQPWAEPTGYGLGKSGWVTLRFASGDLPALAELCAWLEESYRAVAPKTLVKELDARGPSRGPDSPARPSEKKTRKKRAPRRRA